MTTACTSAVRDLLDKWRAVGTGDVTVTDALGRGGEPFQLHVASLTALDATYAAALRCAEMLADALQADAANDYIARCEVADAAERERALEKRTDRDFRPSAPSEWLVRSTGADAWVEGCDPWGALLWTLDRNSAARFDGAEAERIARGMGSGAVADLVIADGVTKYHCDKAGKLAAQ